jgi:hypothetical protein
VGTDRIQACIGSGETQTCSNVVEKEWTKEVINLEPLFAQNEVDTTHTVTATVQDTKGNPIENVEVTLSVVQGPNTGTLCEDPSGECKDSTDDQGKVSFTYKGDGGVGTDYIRACFTNAAGNEVCTDYDGRVGGNAIKEWGEPCPPIEVDPDEIPDAVIGEYYSQKFTGYGGASPYTFEFIGTKPPNLDFINGDTLAGYPTTEGTYTFTIKVTDANDCIAEREYTLHVCPGVSLNPNTSALPDGQVGRPYQQIISASDPNATYQLTGYLPPGLGWSEGSIIIQGIPTQTGTWEFTIIATVPGGCSVNRTYTITIRSAAPIPTVSEWGMIILALILAMISVVAIRRRRIIS